MGLLDRLLGRGAKPHTIRRPRVGARVPIEERAEMHRLKDRSGHSVILEDLSGGGARISTPLKLAKGEQLTLIISALKRESFTVGCAVVSFLQKPGRLHYAYGVKFVAVKPGEIERLHAFVAARDDARKAGKAFI